MASDNKDALIREAVERGFEAGRRSAGRLCNLFAAELPHRATDDARTMGSGIAVAQAALRAIGAELAPTSRSGIPITRNRQ